MVIMRTDKKNTKFTVAVILLFLSSLFIISSIGDLSITDPNDEFVSKISGVNFTANTSITTVTYTSTYAVFNGFGFNVTNMDGLGVNITISGLDASANVGDNLVEFYVTCSSGLVWLNLSGFTENYTYHISKDNVFSEAVTANSTGVISFSNSVWSTHVYGFTVVSDPGGGPPANSAPVVTLYYPSDGSTLYVLQPICRVLVTDANSDASDVSFYNSIDGVSWTHQQTNGSSPSGSTLYWSYSQASLYDTLYYWRVYANDGTINISRIFSFTTYQNEPVISSNLPVDGAIDIIANTTLSVTVFDYQGHDMNFTWRSNSSGSWVDLGYNLSVNNGTYSQRFINSTEYNTKYWWSVNISDGSVWTNETYSFTTEINVAPVIDEPIPRDGKTRISIYMDNVSVMITDANNDFNYTIETSPNIGSISEDNVVDGVKTCTVSGLNYSTVYTWFVNASDGEGWTNTSYTFTTKSSTDFDLEDFKLNFPEWALGPYKVYVGDFVWMFLFIGVIAITWGSSKHISSVLMVILLLFAAYGTQRVFVDNSEISLLFSIIAAASIAAIMLGLFLRKRYG